MQNGNRWVLRESTTGKWLKSANGPPIRIELCDDVSEALRYGTKFRAVDDANELSRAGRNKKGNEQLRGMLFEVYEFDDSERKKQVLPYRVFTPKAKEE